MTALLGLMASVSGLGQPPEVSPSGDVLPIRFTPDKMPLVQGYIGDQPVWLAVDTGATGSFLTARAVNRLKLKPVGAKTLTSLVNGNRVETQPHLIPSLWLGRTVSRSFSIPTADLALAGAGAALGVEVDGLLGGDLLSRMNAVVDYGTKTVRLTPQWAGDLTLMQGTWVATQLDMAAGEISDVTRANLHRVRLTLTGDRMRLDMRGIESDLTEQQLTLLVEYNPRRWSGSWMRVNGGPSRGARSGQEGLYEVGRDRLRLLMPTRKHVPFDQLPTTLAPAPPDSGLALFTFERVTPALSGWPRLVLGALATGTVTDRPVQLGGWEWAVAYDWSLTATHPGRGQRLTARLDGSFTVQPLRP